jgi:endogenous inhibitor of DNA gyrase (YacG/DUF329 family)
MTRPWTPPPKCVRCGTTIKRDRNSRGNWREKQFCSYACRSPDAGQYTADRHRATNKPKLTEAQMKRVRELRAEGASYKALSEHFGVGEYAIKTAIYSGTKLSDFALKGGEG